MRDLRVHTRNALAEFAAEVYGNRHRFRRVTVVTPWLSLGQERRDPVRTLRSALEGSICDFWLLTREPERHWHDEAIRYLCSTVKCSLFFNRHVHAKIYILTCDDYRYAMIGSPNLTKRGHAHNREVAISLRSTATSMIGKDDLRDAIHEIQSYASELFEDEDSRFQKQEL